MHVTRKQTAHGEPHEVQSTALAPDGLPPLRKVIEAHGLSAKKSFGQNFILDFNLTRRIAKLCGDLSELTAVEVGPGPGGLTRALLMEGARRVISVEKDERCTPVLEEIAKHFNSRFEFHLADAMSADWRSLLGVDAGKAVIAANLPYGLASLLLAGWLETEPWPPWWSRMVLMFQKEVAERIVAAPGGKEYGRLSVLSQWRSKPKLALTLPPDAFTPPPKVSSAVVVFDPIAAPHPACKAATLSKVTAAAFGQRRKMLRQSLKSAYHNPETLLSAAGIDGRLRAEQLSVRDFANLAYVLERLPT